MQTYIDYFYLTFNNLPNVMEQKNYFGSELPAGEEENEVPGQLIELLKSAEEQSRRSSTEVKCLQSYLHAAEELLEQNNHVAAAYLFKRVTDRAKLREDKVFLLLGHLGTGKCMDRQKMTEEAVGILEETLSLAMHERAGQEEIEEIVRKLSSTLIGIYQRLAERAEKYEENTTKALSYYEQCLEVARKSGEEEEEGSISYKIGELYYKKEEYKKSVEFQEKYLEIVKNIISQGREENITQKGELATKTRLMEAHASLAKCYLKLKETALAETHLFEYNGLAKDNRLYNAEADSSYYLAKLYEQKLQPNKAIEYYRKYFEAAKLERHEKDSKLVDRARVTYAIAKSNDTIDRYIKIVAESERNIAALLEWKNKRDAK
jgi:tetratricopeptide (TPR) repeat protein